MSFGKSDPPQPPNPIAVAGAQTATNVSTAIANAFLNNTNQVTPQGSVSYAPTDSYTFTDPTTGSSYTIPRFTATQTLSPEQQNILAQSQQAQQNLAGLAAQQSGNIANLLSNPINLSQAPAPGDISGLQNLPGSMTSFADTGQQQFDLGPSDFSADRSHVEEALFGRLNPQLDRSRAQLEQQLADQGIRYGSPAYAAAMDNWNRQANDLRLGVAAQAGQEQQRMFEMALGRGQFYNTAQQNAYAQALGRGNFYNAGVAQQAQLAQARIAAENAQRAQYLQEQYALRQEPINEITALLSGSQVSKPSFISQQANPIPTTDIAGLINQNFAQQFGNYQAQNAQRQATMGGLLGLGGNLALASALSDRRAKENIHRMGTVFAADDEGERAKLPIYEFSYKHDPASTRHVGPMAQDVEKIDPGAVGRTRGGLKTINPRRVMGAIMRAA